MERLVKNVLASFSILLKWSTGNLFKRARGLYQGNLSSPMMFILATEVSTRLFIKGWEVKILSGFKASLPSQGIPLFQFVEDTLIMVKGSFEACKNVKSTLIWYAALSGFHVNVVKLVLFNVNSSKDWDSVLSLRGCDSSMFHVIQLGLPLSFTQRIWFYGIHYLNE